MKRDVASLFYPSLLVGGDFGPTLILELAHKNYSRSSVSSLVAEMGSG